MAPLRALALLLLLLALNHLASPVSAQITSLSDCTPDFLESPIPNDSFQNSTYVALPVMAPALTLCPAGDMDFFRFKLTEETKLTFAISCNTPGLKLEGFLWDFNRGRLVLDGASGVCNYTAVLKPQPSDFMWWFFEIKSADPTATGAYSLFIKQGDFCATNDSNFTPDTAQLVTTLPHDGAHSLCPRGTEQWFKVALNETKNMTLVTDCGSTMFPPKQIVGVWSDGVSDLVVINASVSQCYYQFKNLAPRDASNPYILHIYTVGEAAGPYRLVIEETVVWTVPPLPYQLPSHRVFATFVLLTVFVIILCGLIAAFVFQQRQPQEEGLLDEQEDADTQEHATELRAVDAHAHAQEETTKREDK